MPQNSVLHFLLLLRVLASTRGQPNVSLGKIWRIERSEDMAQTLSKWFR